MMFGSSVVALINIYSTCGGHSVSCALMIVEGEGGGGGGQVNQ